MIEWIIVGLSALITQRAIDKRTPKEELTEQPEAVKELKKETVQEVYTFEVDSELNESITDETDTIEENTITEDIITDDGDSSDGNIQSGNDDDQHDVSQSDDEEIQPELSESLMDV